MLNAPQWLPLHSENNSRQQNYSYHFDSKHTMIFVIARISIQNTNLHLEVGRFGLGAKLNVIKS